MISRFVVASRRLLLKAETKSWVGFAAKSRTPSRMEASALKPWAASESAAARLTLAKAAWTSASPLVKAMPLARKPKGNQGQRDDACANGEG